MPRPLASAPRPLALRGFGALVLALLVTVTTLPTATLAAEPPRPIAGYQPAFVSEREAGLWEDCVWAAAEMMLDKWTSGVTIVDRKRLRKLSGDTEGGSSLADVERAFARIGFPLIWSPRGGDNVTWPELLERLERGGGAILLGDYGKLPRYNGRWERGFWAQEGENDDHAMYLDRYDRKRGRIFVMDPLAPAGWTGEWISVAALKKYAWRNHAGRLWVAMTPAASLAPLAGVELGEPVIVADSSTLDVSWAIENSPKGWTYAGSSVSAVITPVAEPDPLLPVVAALPAIPALAIPALAPSAIQAESPAAPTAGAAVPAPPAAPWSTVADGVVRATVPLPTEPGIYLVELSVIDRRLGGEFASTGPFTLYVPGPRAATFIISSNVSAEPGSLVPISFGVRNVGAIAWTDPQLTPDLPPDLRLRHNTRLVGTWVLVPSDDPAGPPAAVDPTDALASTDAESAAALVSPPPPPAVDLGFVPFDAGYGSRVDILVRVPAQAGTWRLVIDIVDDIDGSFALSGSAPGVIGIDVIAPPAGPGAH